LEKLAALVETVFEVLRRLVVFLVVFFGSLFPERALWRDFGADFVRCFRFLDTFFPTGL
jgi:hypothetical protein